MKIAILTLGTRGDVQPYAVLGKALKERGHEVTVSTGGNFEGLVKSYDLDFVPVKANFEELLHSEAGNKIRKNPFLAKKYLNEFVYPMFADAFVTFLRLAKENDRVLFHVKTMADNFSDQFPDKMIKTDLIPAMQPTSEFCNPMFSALPLPSFMNRFSFKLSELGLKMWQKAIKDFRRNAGLPEKFSKPDLPSLYALSESFLPKPKDYPANSYFTGFWTDNTSQELDKDLSEFISNGEPPVLLTFGSMPFVGKLNLTELVKSVVSELETRVILVKGWGLSDTGEIEALPNVKVIAAAPYSKLFPLVKAVVHHGGIGTMASCLVAGKPFFTCPVLYPMGDQHFWGTIAQKKGVALKPVPLMKLTKELLLKNIRELINNKTLHDNAEKLAEQLKKENGIENAINLIENNVR